ncbi:MAG: hypothetical protein H6705_10520 [Myxococcales bacterium]|nr:hypothetical protein [Myxococcales bacterium]
MLRHSALAVALASIAASGCVVPMPIEAEPIEQNLPPFYITAAVTPAFNQIVEFDPEVADVLELRTGPIGDPNAGDRIFFRWFFNYTPSGFPFIAEDGPAEGQSLASLVDGAIINRLQPCVDLTTNAFRETDLHRIEVAFADRPFVADVENSPTPNQTVAAGGYLVRIVWFVRFDRSKCP